MLQADSVRVGWDPKKKRWHVDIQVGEEVIKRPCRDGGVDTSEDALREMAVRTARDEGYDLDAARVVVARG